MNANDSQLPNQLEGRSVKSAGLVEIAKRCTNMFEANMTPEELCERYSRVELFRNEMLVRWLIRLGPRLGWVIGIWSWVNIR